MMTGTAAAASALDYCPATVTEGDKPSLEAEPSPPSTTSNSQCLNVLHGDESMNPRPTTDFQSTANPKDNESDVVMSSAAETGFEELIVQLRESRASEKVVSRWRGLWN